MVSNRVKEAVFSNVRMWKSFVRHLVPPFDIGLVLHACGEALDDVPRYLPFAFVAGAFAVMAPCCVGAVV